MGLDPLCNLEIKFKCSWFEYFPAIKNHADGNQYIDKAAFSNEFELVKRP